VRCARCRRGRWCAPEPDREHFHKICRSFLFDQSTLKTRNACSCYVAHLIGCDVLRCAQVSPGCACKLARNPASPEVGPTQAVLLRDMQNSLWQATPIEHSPTANRTDELFLCTNGACSPTSAQASAELSLVSLQARLRDAFPLFCRIRTRALLCVVHFGVKAISFATFEQKQDSPAS
jgi:hypothetical protein